jgi:hypothetical protein
MLERRPLVQANLLRNSSIAVEQTLIVFSRTPCGALWVDLRILGVQWSSLRGEHPQRGHRIRRLSFAEIKVLEGIVIQSANIERTESEHRKGE